MSKAFREHFGDVAVSRQDMRVWCQRPGAIDNNGDVVYFTEQSHKNTCDVNNIVKKYDKTGLIAHLSKMEARFGDMTGLEFKTAQDQIILAKNMFAQLPPEIRKKFENDPGKLLEFMEDPNNRDEAIKLGMIKESWTVESDGLGEHVLEGENVEIGETK